MKKIKRLIDKDIISKIIEEKKRKGQTIKLSDLRDFDNRKPIEPTVIYIYD